MKFEPIAGPKELDQKTRTSPIQQKGIVKESSTLWHEISTQARCDEP